MKTYRSYSILHALFSITSTMSALNKGTFPFLIMGIFTSVPAIAGDAKIFPGTMCTQLGTSSTVFYSGEGRILNPSTTSAVNVICPIVRDATTKKWISLKVVVADRSTVADISCTAVSAQKDGLHGGFNPETKKTTGAQFNWWESTTLTFGPQSQTRDDGTYFLRCTIPAKSPEFDSSGIYSYRIEE